MSGLAQFFAIQGYNEGYRKKSVEIAVRMIRAHVPASQITEFTGIGQETLADLAADLGVILPDPVKLSLKRRIQTGGE